MSNEKLSNEAQNPPLSKGAVISCLYYLWDSVKVVTVIFTFIFLLFSGAVIAPLLAVTKWFYGTYSKYYNWLFDWYVSQDGL